MEERKRQYEESLQNKILNEYIRIINIPIIDRKDFNLMCDDFLARVRYDREENRDPQPLSWPRPAGIGASTMAIQVLAIPTSVSPAFPDPAAPELYCRGDDSGPNLLPQDRKALDEAVKRKFPTVSYSCRTQERCARANESHYLDIWGCIKARVRLDRSDITARMAKNLHNIRNNRSQCWWQNGDLECCSPLAVGVHEVTKSNSPKVVTSQLSLKDILSARLSCSALNDLIERYRLSLPYRSFPDVQFHPVANDCKHMQYEEEIFAKRFMKGEIGGLTISYTEITNALITSLERAIKRSRIRVYRLGLDYCRISVDAQSFAHLLEVMGIFELSIIHTVTVTNSFTIDLATKPSVKKLERFGILLPTSIDDEYLLESKNDWLAVCGTKVTEAAVNQYIKEFVEGKRTFQYLALELPNTIDSASILLDIDSYLDIDNSIHIMNKQGDRRSLGISDKCIQIYSDMAIHLIEQHMQQTK